MVPSRQPAAVARAAPNAPGRALSAVAALLLLLLCALPLLCVAHCQLSGGRHQAAHGGHHGGHHGAATQGGSGGPSLMLCDHLQGAGEGRFIPAFWPGLAAVAPLSLAGLALLMRLGLSVPLPAPALAGAPLKPPPR